MAEVKVSALTALTGANVDNGDELYIVDTGSPNVSKKITADELAQMPQLSSRYMPLGKLWLSATALELTSGSPTKGTLGNASGVQRRQPTWLLDASTDESVTGWFLTPANWNTYDIYLWWSNAGAGAGDVGFQVEWTSFGDTESSNSNIGARFFAVSAPLQYVAKRTKVNSAAIAATGDEILRVNILRLGANAADTLANDCGLIGVELVRVS